MTLLVINVAVPADLSDAAFHKALSGTLPSLGAFALSFTLIAGFWRDHRRILTAVPVETGVVTRLTLLGLGLVALLPFPTSLLAEYASKPDAVALYASAMAAIHTVHAALLLLTQRQVHPSPDSPPPRPASASPSNSRPASWCSSCPSRWPTSTRPRRCGSGS
ncbi:TMEM175 family protein [Streptomyces sp. AD2-2]|nr:TMEM175 family protein [Streptomyces sp. AD2-2]